MADIYADRVKEFTRTYGTGTIDLGGPEIGHQSFVVGFGEGANRRYGVVAEDGGWEIGEGTVTAGTPDTLSRDTIFSNSNGDTSPIVLTGLSVVYSTLPASRIRLLNDAEFITFDKASGNGIKVDTGTPVFGFADILGNVTQLNVGASKPTFAVYRDTLKQFKFAVGKEEYFEYHIPHDYVIGSDIFLHVHWSHTSSIVTGGSVDFEYEMSYCKSHDQAAFPASFTDTLTVDASTTQYQQMLSEAQVSASSPSAVQIDSDDLEPDGLIICRLKVAANNITSEAAVPDPFIHYVDIHYQTTGLIGTKGKAPDFYV